MILLKKQILACNFSKKGDNKNEKSKKQSKVEEKQKPDQPVIVQIQKSEPINAEIIQQFDIKLKNNETLNNNKLQISFQQQKGGNDVIYNVAKETLKKIQKPKLNLLEQMTRKEIQIESVNDLLNSNYYKYVEKFIEQAENTLRQNEQIIQQFEKGEQQIDYVDFPKKSQVGEQDEGITENLNEQFQRPTHQILGDWREEMKMKEEIHLYKDYNMKPYPGSSLGPNPQDDPNHYAEWMLQNMPQAVSQRIQEMNAVDENVDQQTSLAKIEDPGSLDLSDNQMVQNSITNIEMCYQQADEQVFIEERHIKYQSHKEEWEIDVFPESHPFEWNQAQDYVEKWGIFRLFPLLMKTRAFLEKFEKNSHQMSLNTEVPRLSSLFIYYNTLPEFARTHPAVTNVVRCLEFSRHDLTIQQKELALNYACQFTLEMDKFTKDVMNEGIISQKYFISATEEDILLKDNDQNDEDQKVNKKGEQSITKQQKKETSLIEQIDWNRPDYNEPEIPEEQLGEELPLQFYDNDDGFWNDYVNYKEIQSSSLDMIHFRPYFKH